MPTIKHSITIDGQTLRRTSKSRTYTRAVIAKRSLEHDLTQARSEAVAKHHRSNYAYYHLLEQAGGDWYATQGKGRPSYRTEAEHTAACAEDLATARKKLGSCTCAEDFVLQEVNRSTDAIRANEAKGYYTNWIALGWCSRLDLAGKLLASDGRKPWYTDAQIVAVD